MIQGLSKTPDQRVYTFRGMLCTLFGTELASVRDALGTQHVCSPEALRLRPLTSSGAITEHDPAVLAFASLSIVAHTPLCAPAVLRRTLLRTEAAGRCPIHRVRCTAMPSSVHWPC